MRDTAGITRTPTMVDEATVWKASQSLWLEQHWQFDGELLRVQIKRNAYDDQSSAHVCCWSPISRGWNHLCQLPIKALPVHQASYVHEASSPTVQTLMGRSVQQLLTRAVTILGARPDYWDRQE